MYIEENYKRILENVNSAASKAGVPLPKITAVTKTVPYEAVNYAISLGIDTLGENRVQEFLSKKDYYNKTVAVNFIGSLQTNKVKYITGNVNLIESVNSEKLALEINSKSLLKNIISDILLEINIGKEAFKTGILPELLPDILPKISEMKQINLRGFMVIPPRENVYEYFLKTKTLFDDNIHFFKKSPILSMGMSGDYETAISCGSTEIRIGSALFGERK